MESVDIYNKLIKNFDSTKVLINEPMKKHTSFKTGGNADVFVKPSNIDEIKYIVDFSKKENIPLTIVGNGTNLIVKDNGIRGIVMKIDFQYYDVKKNNDKVLIKAGAGVPLTKISNLAKNNSASGLEFAVGIPGTIGGAVYMNAGAYGSEMKNVVKTTTYMDLDGNINTISNSEHHFEYRNSVFSKNNCIILETLLELPIGDSNEIKASMKQNVLSRTEKQPLDKPNAGSTFKRGNGFITAKLIDECGLKGYKIGGAEVSTKHAGFIVNSNHATSKDILNLSEYVKSEVYKKFNVNIELEVKVIGE